LTIVLLVRLVLLWRQRHTNTVWCSTSCQITGS